MDPITLVDLVLINNLSSRIYSGNRLRSNATEDEKAHLVKVKHKLKSIADYFSRKYEPVYGPFRTDVASGNDIAIGGTNLKRVWSGIFKGASNKQYAAQISFVMNTEEACLDVGFYFGRASSHSLTSDQRRVLEKQLNNLGTSLSDAITTEPALQSMYNSLFDFGFTAYSDGNSVLADDWYNLIRKKTKSSQIVAKIYPNDFDVIENSVIDLFISQIIFLMVGIRETDAVQKPITIKPLTPEQRAKQAERRAQIGQKGELYVMNHEREKLSKLGIAIDNYPKHVALESMHYGYDILSIDESGNEIYIEVKTTTRAKEDLGSRRFFLSTNEFDMFLNYKQAYKLYRVYDIENNPSLDVLDLNLLSKSADGFIVEY